MHAESRLTAVLRWRRASDEAVARHALPNIGTAQRIECLLEALNAEFNVLLVERPDALELLTALWAGHGAVRAAWLELRKRQRDEAQRRAEKG